jgi:hypothetical protein
MCNKTYIIFVVIIFISSCIITMKHAAMKQKLESMKQFELMCAHH